VGSNESSYKYCFDDLVANKLVLRAVLQIPHYVASNMLLSAAGFKLSSSTYLSSFKPDDVVQLDLGITSALFSSYWREWFADTSSSGELSLILSNRMYYAHVPLLIDPDAVEQRERQLIATAIYRSQLTALTSNFTNINSYNKSTQSNTSTAELSVFAIHYGNALLHRSKAPSATFPKTIPLYTKFIFSSPAPVLTSLVNMTQQCREASLRVSLYAPFDCFADSLQLFRMPSYLDNPTLTTDIDGTDAVWSSSYLEVITKSCFSFHVLY